MDQKHELRDRFNLSQEKVELWKKDQKNCSLIQWALEKGEIDKDEYHDWAANHYGFPKLKAKFLNQHIDKNLLKEYPFLIDQNAIPMKKWGGFLYIACFEPLKDIDIEEDIHFLLAPFDPLMMLIKDIKDGVISKTPKKVEEAKLKPVDYPEGLIAPDKNIVNVTEEELPDGLKDLDVKSKMNGGEDSHMGTS